MKLPLEQLEMAGLKVEGDRAAVESWLNALDPVPAGFPIVEP
jgi:alkyl sulfatase BDS1-like metallo-beta-lactamase superfamily hydrolase